MVLILADVLCAIRFTVVSECLIVEIVITCAACMRVICVSLTFLGESYISGCVPNGHTDMGTAHVRSAIHMFTRVVYLFCAHLEYWPSSPHA